MKRVINVIIFISYAILVSCISPENCTSGYNGLLKIDSANKAQEKQQVNIKYIGGKERDYEKNFSNLQGNSKLPYYEDFTSDTFCSTEYFKKNNYNFLEIKNNSNEYIYICAIIFGAETGDTKFIGRHYSNLLEIYGKEDKDPTYDYTKDKDFKNVKYIDRYELYEKLLKEKYPYIIKVPPQKTCIMKWGGFGFKVL